MRGITILVALLVVAGCQQRSTLDQLGEQNRAIIASLEEWKYEASTDEITRTQSHTVSKIMTYGRVGASISFNCLGRKFYVSVFSEWPTINALQYRIDDGPGITLTGRPSAARYTFIIEGQPALRLFRSARASRGSLIVRVVGERTNEAKTLPLADFAEKSEPVAQACGIR